MRKIVFGLLLSAGFLMAEGWFVGGNLGSTSASYKLKHEVSGFGTDNYGSNSETKSGLSLQGGYDYDTFRTYLEFTKYSSDLSYIGIGALLTPQVSDEFSAFVGGGFGIGSASFDDPFVSGDVEPDGLMISLKAGGLYRIDQKHEIEFGVSYTVGELEDDVSYRSYWGDVIDTTWKIEDLKLTRFYIGYNFHF